MKIYTLVTWMVLTGNLIMSREVSAFHSVLSLPDKIAESSVSRLITDTILPPWDKIDLTEDKMKPGYPFVVDEGNTFPWIPVIGGVVAVGTVTYFLTKDDEGDPVDCSFTASAQPTTATCGLSNGSIQLAISPPGEYTYTWSNGASSSMISEVSAGTYMVTITRTGTSCSEIVSSTIPNQNPFFDATISTQPSACDQENGSATVTPSPPGAYSFLWSNGSTQQNQSGLAPGKYTLTVSAGGECEKSFAVQIGTVPFEAAISFTTTPSTCGLADGTATAEVNPPGNYTYSWSNGQTGTQANSLTAGSYTLTVSIPGTNCMAESSVVIEEATPEFTVTTSSTPAGCGLTDGTATAVADPPGEYTYTWSNGQTGSQITGLVAGTYNVTVSISGTTCTQEASVTIDELPATFTVSVSSTPAGCGLTDGTATATVDPAGEYTYTWSNGQTGAQATGLGAGTYNVTVSISGTTCTQTTSVTVDELPAGFTVSVSSTPAGCGLTDGTAAATVDPAGEYTYTWSNGQTGAQATGLGAGTYNITVSISGTTCTQTTSVTVDELPAGFTVSVSSTPAGCGLTDGTATATVDPAGEYTIVWSNGQSGPQASGLAAGDYSVSVTVPGTTCEVTTSFIVEQSGGNLAGVVTTDDSSCGLADGTATLVVNPPGEYLYAWSSGQTGPVAAMLPAGTYTVTVTDINQCTGVFSAIISELPPAYISIIGTTPGTCSGGGEIHFTLSTPGEGPLFMEVVGPEGSTTQTLAPGTYALSAFIPVPSGNYTFTVYDLQIGTLCTETVLAPVGDNTPPLIVTDDFYTTPGGQPLDENALDNDSGLDLMMTDVADEFGGTVTFNSSGAFTFIPDPGFSGDASFTYTVTDACGNTATAVVVIFVEELICDFQAEFDITPASCGLEDGSITADVIEPGSYTYLWSNGDSGPVINNVGAGSYSVTITDTNLGCSLVFTAELGENPAEHISDVIITQPACGVDGEIQFTATTGSQNPLVMTVSHPNGSDLFFIDPGVILLSDYIAITPGDYTIEIFDAGAGADCTESLEVTLVATPAIEIIAEVVLPPSEPTAMDGLAIIVAIVPGTLPYEILLNGNSWGVAIDHTFQVGGLEVGEYTIQIIDAEGCVSNILVIMVPFPDVVLSFGTSILQTSTDQSNEVPVSHEPAMMWRNALTASVGYYIGHLRQEVFTRYGMPLKDHPGFVEIAYMADIGRYTLKGVSLALQGGIGSHFEKKSDHINPAVDIPTYFLLRAGSGYTIARRFRLQGSVEMRFWERIEKPRLEIGLSIPFCRSTLRWGN